VYEWYNIPKKYNQNNKYYFIKGIYIKFGNDLSILSFWFPKIIATFSFLEYKVGLKMY